MAQLQSIISTRFEECWPSFYFVHEWEDIFQRLLNLSFKEFSPENMRLLSLEPERLDLTILPLAKHIQCYQPHKRVISIVVDCWRQDVSSFLDWYAESPMTYLASLEALRDIRASGFTGNLGYMPMSISDALRREIVPEKYVDVIQYGRTNPVLDGYMKQFCRNFPQVNYVTMEILQNRICYKSTKYGSLGDMHERHRFLGLLAASRVSLVSSPGMDGSKDTGGYNPVAVRFFESASQFCYMLGRYPANDDFSHCNVELVCDAVQGYDEFEDKLITMLSKPFNLVDEFNAFLDLNVTSRRVKQLCYYLDSISADLKVYAGGLRANLLGAGF